MVINIIVPPIGTSGGIDVVYKYVELLRLRGHDVCVYKELKASNMHRYQSKIKNILHQIYCSAKAIICRRLYQNDSDKYVWILSDQTLRDADITIATAWTTAFSIAKLSENKGKKFYFIQDYEIWDNIDFVKKSYELPLNKIVISMWINRCLMDGLGIGPFPVVHNGIDTHLYCPRNKNNQNDEYSFIMLNHKLKKKGVEYGLKAFERIKSKFPSCKLRMFGLCAADNLPAYVEYYQKPSREKIIELYSISNIFIFPSLEEGWGLTPIEAMACGCIVVGTSVGFAFDVGINRKNMMISEPKDVDGMVHNIEEVISNPKLRQEIRNNSYALIHDLSWSKSADKLLFYLSHMENE